MLPLCQLSELLVALIFHLLLHYASGGERQVFHLLENRRRDELSEQLLESQDKTQAHNRSRVYTFFCDPNALGENLYTIIKFGLVQYVSYFIICSLTRHWQIMTCHNFVWQNCRWFWRHYVLCWRWSWSLLEPMAMVNSSGITGICLFHLFLVIEISKTSELEETENWVFIASDS
jgi:hypothetical protein